MDDGSGGVRSRRYEFDGETNASPAGLTLGGILSIKQTPPYRIHDRTLLDLIRDDQTCRTESKKTWKILREKLRLKLAGSVCTTTVPTLASHIAITTDSNRMTTRHSTTQQNVADESTQTAGVRTELPVAEHVETLTEEPTAARMSLMSLLEVDGSSYLEDGDEDEETEEQVVAEEDGAGEGYKYNNCCVCMVRHKGAAFIPCGHTFCRLCSRELFVKRASCPLCNNFILEILDIF